MRFLNSAFCVGLLFTLGSCGGDSNGASSPKSAINPLVTSADWKILIEGRSFPDKSLVIVNDEVVVNECADKQTYFINRESNPQSLPMANYLVPTSSTLKIEVTDMGENCDAESSFFSGTDVPFEITKDGAHAEVIVRL